jgi:hypothetical protein
MVADIKRRRLGWLEHVTRMDQTVVAKKIFGSKPEDEREVRRPRLRRSEDAENYLGK